MVVLVVSGADASNGPSLAPGDMAGGGEGRVAPTLVQMVEYTTSRETLACLSWVAETDCDRKNRASTAFDRVATTIVSDRRRGLSVHKQLFKPSVGDLRIYLVFSSKN